MSQARQGMLLAHLRSIDRGGRESIPGFLARSFNVSELRSHSGAPFFLTARMYETGRPSAWLGSSGSPVSGLRGQPDQSIPLMDRDARRPAKRVVGVLIGALTSESLREAPPTRGLCRIVRRLGPGPPGTRRPLRIVRVATAALAWECSRIPRDFGGTHRWASNNAAA